EGVVADRAETPVPVGGERHMLHSRRLVAVRGKCLCAGEDELDRAVERPRRGGSQDLVRPHVALATETAAHVLVLDPDHAGLETERLSDDAARGDDTLRRVV